MVFQIQYDAPFKVLDTYLTGLNEGQSNNGKLFNPFITETVIIQKSVH